MSAPYKIEFVVNQRNVSHVSWPRHEPLSLETLSDLLVDTENHLHSHQLSFAWIDDEDYHVFVANDSDLREAIEAQTAREASTLRFHVTAVPAASPVSHPISSPKLLVAVEAITTAEEPEETKPLVELSVAEVVSLFESLNMPAGCAKLVRGHKISGRLLSSANSVYALRASGLTRDVLDSNSANKLLDRLPELREKGVPVAFLRNAQPEDNVLPRSIKRPSTDNEDIVSPGKKARLAEEREEADRRRRTSRILSSVRDLFEKSSENNVSPLYLASAAGDVEGVQALLECTYEMVENESEEVKGFMRLSSEERTNRAEEGKHNSTALHAAAENGHTETVRLLLAFNANIEARDDIQHTPVHLAAGQGHTETVLCLLSHQANVEAENKAKYTRLHFASSKGFVDMVFLLIAHNANKEAINEDGQTPLDVAKNEEVRAQFKNA